MKTYLWPLNNEYNQNWLCIDSVLIASCYSAVSVWVTVHCALHYICLFTCLSHAFSTCFYLYRGYTGSLIDLRVWHPCPI